MATSNSCWFGNYATTQKTVENTITTSINRRADGISVIDQASCWAIYSAAGEVSKRFSDGTYSVILAYPSIDYPVSISTIDANSCWVLTQTEGINKAIKISNGAVSATINGLTGVKEVSTIDADSCWVADTSYVRKISNGAVSATISGFSSVRSISTIDADSCWVADTSACKVYKIVGTTKTLVFTPPSGFYPCSISTIDADSCWVECYDRLYKISNGTGTEIKRGLGGYAGRVSTIDANSCWVGAYDSVKKISNGSIVNSVSCENTLCVSTIFDAPSSFHQCMTGGM